MTQPRPQLKDLEAIRHRYAAERDKRIREDGNDQYVEIAGDLAHYVDDPYVEPGFQRDPIDKAVDALIIGGGFGGLLAGARLRQAGVKDICVVEKGGDFGGTWYWNRYPGAQCDVESYIYLPLLEELGYMPKEKYSHAPEILEHSRAIGRHFDLYDGALFQTGVKELRWDDNERRWLVSTDRGDVIHARFVSLASGPLNRPKLPGIPGIRDFKGHTFHTSRWDYNYTGGSAEGGLEKLADKRIAVIGTGATAVQCVPHLAASAKHLCVCQRTPSSIDVRDNCPTDPEWAAELKPGWQRERMDNFNGLVSGQPQEVDLVDDGWTSLIGKMLRLYLESQEGEALSLPEIMDLANLEKMNELRARIEALVEDPDTSEALKPWYRMFCKRPCFHDQYLQTFNRDNVTLADTEGQGVERITESGVVVAGVEYPVDCIVYATGFEVGTGFQRVSGFEIYGRDGLPLSDKWADGIRTLHGMHIHGFPNCFLMSTIQGGFTVNYPHMLDEVATHVAHIVGHALAIEKEVVETSAEAEASWVQTILDKGVRGGIIGDETCTPGYYNNEGKPREHFEQMVSYGDGPIPFFNLLAKWRDTGDFAGLTID
ncbi:MAG: flavin-containing monooxygenase [Luminiphilus sp.]